MVRSIPRLVRTDSVAAVDVAEAVAGMLAADFGQEGQSVFGQL